MKIPAEKTAIVLIEPQNDFLTKGGTMFQYIEEQLKERNVIANLQGLLEGARSKKVKIFYCPFQAFKPGFPELKPGGPGTAGLRGIEMEMKADWGVGAWLDGTPGPEIIDELYFNLIGEGYETFAYNVFVPEKMFEELTMTSGTREGPPNLSRFGKETVLGALESSTAPIKIHLTISPAQDFKYEK